MSEKIVEFPKRTKLFTKEFLDKLEASFNPKIKDCLLDHFMQERGLTFNQAIEELAKIKDMKPEYIS